LGEHKSDKKSHFLLDPQNISLNPPVFSSIARENMGPLFQMKWLKGEEAKGIYCNLYWVHALDLGFALQPS
jgi:hypothetical protein